MTQRSVLTVVLLSIVTCGIYSLYWMYVTAEELNSKEQQEPLTNFIIAVLLGIITCGIYMIYWNYKFYYKADRVTRSNNGLLNFILSIFLPFAAMGIAQDQINKM